MQRQSPRLTRKLWVRAVATLITVLTVSTGRATGIDHREPRLPAIPCTALGQFMIPDAIITSAVNVAASGSVPAYCRVLATVAPETDIEVRLPENWQQRLLHLGGSGLDGVIPNLNLNGAQLAAGYALAASNGGHRDATGGPTRFLNNPVLIEDYAFAAIGKTVRSQRPPSRRTTRRRQPTRTSPDVRMAAAAPSMRRRSTRTSTTGSLPGLRVVTCPA